MDFIYDDYKKIINLLLRNNYEIIKYRDDTQYSKKAILNIVYHLYILLSRNYFLEAN